MIYFDALLHCIYLVLDLVILLFVIHYTFYSPMLYYYQWYSIYKIIIFIATQVETNFYAYSILLQLVNLQ